MATAQRVLAERPRRGRSALFGERAGSVLLLVPSAVLVGIFVYAFIGYTGFVSLTAWRGIVPDYTFVGLEQYRQLLELERFQADLSNTVRFTALFLTASIVLGFGAALLLDQRLRGTILFQNVFLFPLAISFVVTGTVWRWVFNPNYGINLLLERAGLGFLKSDWLTNVDTALYAVVIAAVWQMSGFCMAMFLAGLRSIPEELREAAQVDGATWLQTFRHIILPLLNPILLAAVIILGHISLKIFDLVFVMTFGGPGFATDMPGLHMFIATFRQNLYARGAAIATVLLLMVAVLIVPYLIWQQREERRA
ncbi:MAG TPA: sugar ABC transporter permease [Candidatus Limnocylindria bacterium]|jgi:glucose/mannose transport system permease protein|nr:sugar ABC transporter permease [Candidatus Limnocylindria bacterium]